MLKNKVICITGSEGFIGSSLVNKYKKDNTIIGIDKKKVIGNKDNYIFWCFDLVNSSFKDILMNQLLKSYDIDHIDYIFHCASPVGVDEILADPNLTLESAIKINMNIHELCKQYKIDLIFTSTSEIYGNNEDISISSDACIPTIKKDLRGGYASQKLMSEFLFTNNHYNSLIFRLFNITGSSQDITKGVIPKLINNIINNEPCFVDLHACRTFLHIDDFLIQFEHYLNEFENNDHISSVHNIGDISGINNITIKNLYELIKETINDKGIKYNENISIGVTSSNFNIRGLKLEENSFKPTMTIQNIINEIIETKDK